MKAELKHAWVAALRSGRYQQGHGYLRKTDDRFCCLAVLCEVAGVPQSNGFYDFGDAGRSAITLRGELARQLGVPAINSLVSANDDLHYGFPRIADWIEQRVPEDAA